MTDHFSKYQNTNIILENIRKNSIFLSIWDVGSDLTNIINWCNKTIGLERVRHPIYDAKEFGNIDYDDGIWSVEYVSEYHKQYQMDIVKLQFWFEKEEHLILFKMTWCFNK